MRVLQVNKFLFGKGGAETVMFRTAELLRENGHEVSFFGMQDPRNVPCAEARYFPPGRYYLEEAGLARRAKDALASVYSLQARRSLRELLRDRRPDIAHLHNVYHQLTLSVLDELRANEIPVVMTLHDYKPVCPNYLAYVQNAPCHRCVGGHPAHAILHRCIKGSRAASVVATAEAMLVRARDLYDKVDAFISPSAHLAKLMVAGGLHANRMHVVPNFIADEQFAGELRPPRSARPMALFVGRLEEVKGVRVLLDAARALGPRIDVVIVGSGPLEALVEEAAQAGAVRFLGRLDWDGVASLMDEAWATTVPSIWEENCPMVVLEAGARGCPVVASDRGGLTELIRDGEDGLLFPAGDAEGLAESLTRLLDRPETPEQLGRTRYARTLEQNSSGAHYPALTAVYRQAISSEEAHMLDVG